MKKRKIFFSKDLGRKVLGEEGRSLINPPKFMVISSKEGISIYPLNKNDGFMLRGKPLSKISEEKIKEQNLNNLPNMYYPAVSPESSLKLKTAYFLMKNLFDQGLIKNPETYLVGANYKYLGVFNLIPGR